MPQINRTTDEQPDALEASGEPGRFPGWYLDPRNAEDERFWNGNAWTDLTRAAPKLNDFLGPIEPTLLALLGSDDTGLDTSGIVGDPVDDSFRRVQEFMAN